MKSADIQTKLAKVRATIERLHRERAEIEAAPVSEAEALERIDTFITDLAAQARITADDFTRRAYEPPDLIPSEGLNVTVQSGLGWADVPFQKVSAVLALVAPGLLRTALENQVRAYYANRKPSLDSDARDAALADLDDKLFEIQVEEERLVEQALAAGLAVHRRPDADPRSILAA